MKRVLVRSRSGNVLLAVLGSVYAVSALFVLGWFVVEAWQASGLMELLMQFALVAAGACSIWFVRNALDNLGWKHHRA
jgi:hypothetical protein